MATITEDNCDFETAKLLKEKGFDARCPMIYTADGEMLYTDVKHHNMYAVTNKQLEYCTDIIAPSQSVAMKWLREVHNIHIELNPICYGDTEEDIEWHYGWAVKTTIFTDRWKRHNAEHISYEQACEAAIKYCLKHLIK